MNKKIYVLFFIHFLFYIATTIAYILFTVYYKTEIQQFDLLQLGRVIQASFIASLGVFIAFVVFAYGQKGTLFEKLTISQTKLALISIGIVSLFIISYGIIIYDWIANNDIQMMSHHKMKESVRLSTLIFVLSILFSGLFGVLYFWLKKKITLLRL